jgi:RimJ/RimL family protein N-acetyltransferase
VRIQQFDPRNDEDRLKACHQITVSGLPEDDPNGSPVSLRRFRGWAYGWAGMPQEVWLATDDGGEPVGYYMLTLPDRENRQNAFCGGTVAPSRRRQGIGTTLLVHAAGQAERAGRTLLMGDTRVGGGGRAFTDACGARAGIPEVRRVLDVDADLHGRLAALRAEALPHSAGYSLRLWSGPTPEDLVDEACKLNDALRDAPHDDAFEPLTWDADRLREAERKNLELGMRWYSVAALHDDSGEMAALTDVHVDPDTPQWGGQGLTAVARQHRGHRLGKLVKVAMLEWLAETEPQLRQIQTYNAAENRFMIAVNEDLGHRVTDTFQGWELDVSAALKLGS